MKSEYIIFSGSLILFIYMIMKINYPKSLYDLQIYLIIE